MKTAPYLRAPDYYQKFNCIGSDCEDSCCIGWQVGIDYATWQRYQACDHPVLAPLFSSVVTPPAHKNSVKDQAKLNLLADGRCPFLQSDMLCMIQKELGVEALSETCASYPRRFNLLGTQPECSLGVSCPEAARLILLDPEPINIVKIDAESEVNLFKRNSNISKVPVDPRQNAIMKEFRALIFRILQFRALTLGARIMLLGFLLDEASRVIRNQKTRNFAAILPAMSSISVLFAEPAFIENEFEHIAANLPRKLQIITGFLASFLQRSTPRFEECILAFIDCLENGDISCVEAGADAALMRYKHAYETYYKPYFQDKGYILENYLVNEVFANLFPFASGSYLDQYRVMVLNLTIIQVILVGMAGHFKGLTDELVIQFIQSFARRSTHNNSYIEKLTEAVSSKDAPSFAEVYWLLKQS